MQPRFIILYDCDMTFVRQIEVRSVLGSRKCREVKVAGGAGGVGDEYVTN